MLIWLSNGKKMEFATYNVQIAMLWHNEGDFLYEAALLWVSSGD
jgi:hypothetical protein